MTEGLDAYLVAGAAMLTDDPESAEFSRRGSDGVLRFQQCDRCGYRRYPAAALCPECLATEATWTADSGHGTVWSFCVYHKAFRPAFAALLPYVVALVELDSGPRLITNIVDVPVVDVHIGLRGRAGPQPLPGGLSLVYFFASTQAGGPQP
jgi:uncharacterized OB-fold protein